MEEKKLQAISEEELGSVQGGKNNSLINNGYKNTNILLNNLLDPKTKKYCCPSCAGSLTPIIITGKTVCVCDSCRINYTIYAN